MIRARHTKTGREHAFADKQGAADFLAAQPDAHDWEVPTNIGPLPEPNGDAVQAMITEQIAADVAEIAQEEDIVDGPEEPEAPTPSRSRAAKTAVKKARAR